MSTRIVVAPDGARWRVRRRWPYQRPSRPRWRGDAIETVLGSGGWMPDSGDSLAGWLVGIVAVIVIALVVIPLLLFGVELVVVGCLLAAGIVARVVLGKPWRIEAQLLDGARILEWHVSGWRASSRLIDQVASELEAGRQPEPTVAAGSAG